MDRRAEERGSIEERGQGVEVKMRGGVKKVEE